LLLFCIVPAARATLPPWLQHIVGSSTVESALYRAMQLPAVQALYPRPPKESQSELGRLIHQTPADAELYRLRALADEQALDETVAESDWKAYAAHAADPIPAQLELAEFYQRRLLIPQEIAALNRVAAAPNPAAEEFLDPTKQRAWKASERILGAIAQQGLPPAETVSAFDRFLARYPEQPAVYAADLNFQLEQKDFKAAESLIARYRAKFPHDEVFPVRAQALVEFRRGDIDAALAVYDRAFQPLWPAALVQSYFALLDRTHRQRAFVAEARARLAAHPDGPEALNALARVFYYDQQAGRLDAAQRTLDSFRVAREARNAAWPPADLYTLATLTAATRSYAEAARYNYALASVTGTVPNGEPAAQSGLAGLVHILLVAPDQNLALGSQNLTLYRDIATLDQGPGYWNGILSLWLNGSSPRSEYQSETAKAQTYFHRAKAAELLAELDRRFPAAPERPALHAELIAALANYGEPATVVAEGKQFLAAFPAAPERLDVASLMADAYARQNDTASEFALYDAQLAELSAQSVGMPLTAAANAPPTQLPPGTVEVTAEVTVQAPQSVDADAKPAIALQSQPLAPLPTRKSLPAATAYARVLDRYIGRLTATGDLPHALAVLRTQLDRNPNDPQLYERLAAFLQQNDLSAQQEQVFQAAIAKFQQPTYYDKLARFYLRSQKRQSFADLTRKVTDIFSGTDLDVYFRNVRPTKEIGPQLALQLNLYAAKRFPHDLVFTQNLLSLYQAPAPSGTFDSAAYEALLRQTWWQSPELTDQFLTFLSRTGKLDSELQSLKPLGVPSQTVSSSELGSATHNPAALRELAQIDIFLSHYEAATPLLGQVAALYPAAPDIGDTAVSLYRSLAYLDPTLDSTHRAVALETNLLTAEPDSPDRLATLGDLYAEATSRGGEDLASATPYWHRIPQLHPGSTQGFLTASTIFWDYFQFDDALGVLDQARTRFHSPALFGYEAGAIDENRHNLPAAIAEYTSAAIHPIEVPRHFDSGFGVVKAWLAPPSDAGDSNLRSTAQSFFGSEESRARLLQLAVRPTTRAAVDSATSQAVAQDPANTAALTLRADILAAQHHAPELAPLLAALFNQALDRARTLDEAEAVGSLAQARGLTTIYERALAQQAALTLDPVQNIQLQYTLAASLEARGDLPAATRVIDSVYQANPRILGVVRATVDFDARAKQPQRAIATLLSAAKVAAPPLARDFTLEAASRANDAGDTAQARSLALALLPASPYDARVLDLIATSYARSGDNAGLKAFYLAQLAAAQTAPGIDLDQRKQNIALLRRGLIPALTRLNDFPGALNQYIALVSAFPEDAGTAQQAALYALKHSLQPQLLAFYRATVKQSPQDSRFAILLAQTETAFDDLPAAEAAYSLAIAIRKDRADLYTARADIEVRLSQSAPAQSELAAADFSRLYLLTYHDPQWMVRLAELRARQQRAPDAVAALKTAYIDGHPPSAADSFTVASRLADWNLLNEARFFAEQGVALAGPDLLNPPGNPPSANQWSAAPTGAAIYARVLARLGHADLALATLNAARKQAEVSATSPTALAAEISRQNLSRDDANSFRQSYAQQRRQTADQTLKSAIEALGQAVQTYSTPEQKLAFAQTLDTLHATKPDLALQAATAAGLADREAAWRRDRLLHGNSQEATGQLQPYTRLQQRRLDFTALGNALEAYALLLRNDEKTPIREQAARAYRDGGDLADETRLDRSLTLADNTDLRDRYFDLLLKHDRSALIALAGNHNTTLADAALNYTLAHATQQQALAAVARRAQTLPPVWRPASASLVETWFASPKSNAAVATDFTQALASNQTIADRLATLADPKRQLTGDTFFYYASRFGIYLATLPASEANPPAEDFLPAELEQAPTAPTPYLNLARTYAEANQIPAAVAEYDHALSLTPAIPGSPAIEDELAQLLYRTGRKDEAEQHWHAALATLRRMQQHAIYPESWFTSLEAIVQHLGERGLTAAYTSDIETIVGPYLAKNGAYRSNELLKAVYLAAGTPAQGDSLLFALANFAPDPNLILENLHTNPALYEPSRGRWVAESSQVAILLRQIELAKQDPSRNESSGYGSVLGYQLQLIELYLTQNRVSEAQAAFDALPSKQANTSGNMLRIILAVRSGHLSVLLDSWRANPESIPNETDFGSALYRLQRATATYKPDPAAIRPLVEFVFEEKDHNDQLQPTDFLSLAQLRIDTNDMSGAIQLLRRFTLQPASSYQDGPLAFPNQDPSGNDFYRGQFAVIQHRMDEVPDNTYQNTDYAATLLEHSQHPAEAIPFLQMLTQEVPWDATYRLRLAEAQRATGNATAARANLIAVAKDPTAPYETRVEAARDLAPDPAAALDIGSRELVLIVHPETPEAAQQSYFVAARIAAAALPSTSATTKETLLREAISIAPTAPSTNLARLNLLLAQPSTADASATLAIFHSIDTSQPNTYGQDYAYEDSNSAPGSTSAALPPVADTLALPARIALATQLSIACERDGDLPTALAYAQIAVELAQKKPDPALSRRRDALATAVTLTQRNAARVPILAAALAQSNQVRPRLTPADLAKEALQ
jgi:tetratricopeptide (TPR) repeat protein